MFSRRQQGATRAQPKREGGGGTHIEHAGAFLEIVAIDSITTTAAAAACRGETVPNGSHANQRTALCLDFVRLHEAVWGRSSSPGGGSRHGARVCGQEEAEG